ncbi:MAG TPA: enolase C-terminal domain-like protein [Parapedobacter sp.]|uniref:enolase C-terminal domain-like protein n=1 Tax=Parapedobacter sp. TaxID=1958893 RepID=UPI002C524A6B|nr:enolase C-terminal domain-like protein [Parapedobacter sp.]HWK58583.1 enolase C-terminal domain-like protein [Parapedobacter sp.]
MRRREFIYMLNTGVAAGVLSQTAFGGVFRGVSRASRMQDELAYHTIQSVTFDDVRMQYPRFVGKNARLDVHGYGPRIGICTITTDKGAKGWASLRGGRDGAQRLVPELVGKKISDVFHVDVGITDDRYLPFDIALHDLAGVALNKPVYALLGREKPFTTKYYSGMIYFDDLEPSHAPGGIDKVLANCRYDYEYGYRQFKLKIGRGHRWMAQKEGLARDIAVTKQVAAAFPDCEILVDGNNGFTVNEFTAYLEGIGDTPLFWIEEPFHETIADYRKLRDWMAKANVQSLLAEGEADPDPVLLDELMQQKLMDVHISDIEGLGFTNWRKLMPKLVQYGVQASPHAWGSLLKTYYTAHMAGGLGNTVTIEGVTSTSDDIDLSGYTIKDGHLIPPTAPGFGLELLR